VKIGMTLGGLLLAGTAVIVGQSLTQTVIAVPGDDGPGGAASVGPDVIVGGIPNYSKYGTTSGVSAYAFGSTSCNMGTVQLDWVAGTNQHPVIPQNAYRIKGGRIEQIGMSWVKHGFCALQQTLCGTCSPAGPGCPSSLGVGCSDPYDSTLNGDQGGLGPRSLINAASGFFPYPYTAPPFSGNLARRVQIKLADLDPAQNTGAVYYAECQYIHPDDSAAGNDNNNASYRKFNVGSLSGGSYNLSLTGATIQEKPAIYAWKDVDAAVTVTAFDVPNDGRYYLAYKASNNLNGTWHYEFAIFNLNSDRSGHSFSVPVPDGVTISNVGFKDVDHHSGEPYTNTDWTFAVADGALTWTADATFASNPNANALRWSTMFNFWFDADTDPQPVLSSLGLFKPGTVEGDPNSVNISVAGPSEPPCPGDYIANGVIDGSDLAFLLGAWGTDDGDLTGNNTTDAADLAVLLGAWGPCK
jgi:hypothetical protein